MLIFTFEKFFWEYFLNWILQTTLIIREIKMWVRFLNAYILNSLKICLIFFEKNIISHFSFYCGRFHDINTNIEEGMLLFSLRWSMGPSIVKRHHL